LYLTQLLPQPPSDGIRIPAGDPSQLLGGQGTVFQEEVQQIPVTLNYP
jgi:hypothetical protein